MKNLITAATFPSAIPMQIVTYCECEVNAAMTLWSASDFAANAQADAKVLVDDGTTAACKKQAAL